MTAENRLPSGCLSVTVLFTGLASNRIQQSAANRERHIDFRLSIASAKYEKNRTLGKGGAG